MALGTAAAILGSAVIGAGASAITSSKAAGKAADASQYAADQSAQVNREALQTAQQNTATSRAAGDLATNALASRFGLIPNGSTLTPGNVYAAGDQPQSQSRTGVISDMGFGGYRTDSQPPGNIYTSTVPYSATQQSPAAGSTDWGAVLADRPDVAAAVNDPNGGYSGATVQQRTADWYSRYGNQEGYQLPTVQAPQPATAQPTQPSTTPAVTPQVQTSPYDVQLSAATQVPTYARPADVAAPAAYVPNVYAAPTYVRPDYTPQLDVSYETYLKSGDAKAADFDIAKQGGQVQASLAAQGLLNSGAALKRLQEVGQDNKVKYYGQFRDYTTGQYNTDRARFDNNYNFDTNLASQNALAYAQLGQADKQFGAGLDRSDYQYGQNRADNIFNLDRAYGTDLALNNRNYETSRYDTQTGNLFNLANQGQGAAASATGAAQNYANNTSQNLFSSAANQGNAALASASNINNLIGSGLSALGYAYGQKKAA